MSDCRCALHGGSCSQGLTVHRVQGPSGRCLTHAFSGTPGTDTIPPHKEVREGSRSSWGLGCMSQYKGFQFFLAGLAWWKAEHPFMKAPADLEFGIGSTCSLRQHAYRIRQAEGSGAGRARPRCLGRASGLGSTQHPAGKGRSCWALAPLGSGRSFPPGILPSACAPGDIPSSLPKL